MDYNRLKEVAQEFVGQGCQDCPEELESVLRETARTGVTRLQWDLMCPILQFRLEMVLNSTFSSSDMDSESQETSQQLLKQLNSFSNAPFTVQRLCELVLDPKKHYKRLNSFIRAVEKNLLVVSTQEPDLQWMQCPRLTHPLQEKPKQDNTTTNKLKEPRSPTTAPKPPPTKKDSPPTAPTSTWPNLRDMLEEGPREVPDFSQGRVREDSQKELQSSYGGDHPPLLSTRKRSSSLRGSMELEEDGSSITVLQEADSTVNFEPPPLDGMEEITSKRLRGSSRRAEVEEREEGEVEGEEGGEAESLKSLLEKNSVTQAVESGRGGGKGERGGGGGGGGGGGSSEEHTVVLGSSRSEHASDSMQGPKQVSSDCIEAMDTD